MNVTLVTSPHVRHAAVLEHDFSVDQSVMYGFAPLGLLSVIASLRRTIGLEAALFDLNRQIINGALQLTSGFYSSAARAILSTNPDVIGFMTECDSYHHVLQITAEIKRENPYCKVVLGGPHATAVATKTLERHNSVDAIVMGEGENSFPQLLTSIQYETSDAIPGVIRRGNAQDLADGGPVALVDNLDNLPIPAYDVYQPDIGEELFLEVGRGCPFPCTFCSTAPFWSRRHRVKSPDRILNEIDLLKNRFGTERIHFTHDLLTADRSWVMRLCDALISARPGVKWTCSARTDTVDDKLLESMSRAGCNAIYFGVESGSPRILGEIKKQIPLKDSFNAIRSCIAHGISPNVGFILGFPTEDKTSFEETLVAFEKSIALGCKPSHIFGYCPFAQSSGYPASDSLECTGHFVDLPIDQCDETNRDLIASDCDLFGAYFRPTNPGLRHLLHGVDEFSSLVGSARLPTLLLAKALGGMPALYSSWIEWISARNDARQAAEYRKFYGSPLEYCDFLVSGLATVSGDVPHGVALARAFRAGLQAAAYNSNAQPTTMATYRSATPVPSLSEIGLDTFIGPSGIVAHMSSPYDIVSMLSGDLDFGVPSNDTINLVWWRSSSGDVRLFRVTDFVYHSLTASEHRPSSIGELFGAWSTSPSSLSKCPALDLAIEQVEEALQHGIVTVYEQNSIR